MSSEVMTRPRAAMRLSEVTRAPQGVNGRRSLQPPVPAGTHVARCCGWVELGTVEVPWKNAAVKRPELRAGVPASPGAASLQKRVLVWWMIRGRAGECWRVSREMALSAGPKSGLRKLLEQWRGKAYASDAAARSVLEDPRRLLEQPCLVSVRFKEGSTWPIVSDVLPLPQGLGEVERLRWPPVLFRWAQPCKETFKGLSPWVQRKIRGSAEWASLAGIV